MENIFDRFRQAFEQPGDHELKLRLRFAGWWIRFMRRSNSERIKIELALWLVWLVCAILAAPAFNGLLAPIAHEYVFSELQELVVAVGLAMIGATAIVASFVLFALQVNVERLPYGLLGRFSSDWRLLGLFGASFGLSITGTSLALIMNRDFVTIIVMGGIAIAGAPATTDHARDELRKHVSRLLAALSWVPRDVENSKWIEAYSFSEMVFEFAVMSARRNFDEGFDDAWKLLLNWGLEAGRASTGWGTLGNALMGLTALALLPGQHRATMLETQLTHRLAGPNAPEESIRRKTARDLREQADELGTGQYTLRAIERLLDKNDREPTEALLHNLANILSPADAGEAGEA